MIHLGFFIGASAAKPYMDDTSWIFHIYIIIIIIIIGASAAKPHMDDTSGIFHILYIIIIYYYRRTSDRSKFALAALCA